MKQLTLTQLKMMNASRIAGILACLAATATFTACSSDDEVVDNSDPVQAQFSACISAQVTTRATDATWEAGDAIGISGLSGSTDYLNIKYNASLASEGSASFTVDASETEGIYYQDNNEVTFSAYYPWTEAADSKQITANTTLQSKQGEFDFLWAQAVGSKATPVVNFTFNHMMTKLVLTIKHADGVTYDESKAAALALGGFKPEGTFDIYTGLAAAAGEAVASYKFAGGEAPEAAPMVENGTTDLTYTFYFFPQEFSAPISFTADLGTQQFEVAGGISFQNANATLDSDAKNAWVAGRQYNLSVTLHKTGLVVDGCTIIPWNNLDLGSYHAY